MTFFFYFSQIQILSLAVSKISVRHQSVLKVWVNGELEGETVPLQMGPQLSSGDLWKLGFFKFWVFPSEAPACLNPCLSLRKKEGSKKEGTVSCHSCSLLLSKSSFIKGERICSYDYLAEQKLCLNQVIKVRKRLLGIFCVFLDYSPNLPYISYVVSAYIL